MNRTRTMRRGGWRATAWAVGVSLVACLSALAGPGPGAAMERLARGDAAGARREYEQLLERTPKDPRLAFNAGVAAHQMGDWDAAARHHESAMTSPDISLQQKAFFGLGSARFRQGEAATEPSEKARLWEESARSFHAAMGLGPADTDARANYEAVREQLARLQREQSSKEPDKGQEQRQQQQQQDPQQKNEGDKQQGQQGGEGKDNEPKDQAGRDKQGSDGQKGRESKDGKDGKDGRGAQRDPAGKQEPDTKGGNGKDKQNKPGEQGPGGRMEENRDGKTKQEQAGKGKGGKDGEGGPKAMEQGSRGTGEASGANGAAGEEQASGSMGEDGADGRMAMKFAERLLDSHKREERALIWAAPRANPSESRNPGRKTW